MVPIFFFRNLHTVINNGVYNKLYFESRRLIFRLWWLTSKNRKNYFFTKNFLSKKIGPAESCSVIVVRLVVCFQIDLKKSMSLKSGEYPGYGSYPKRNSCNFIISSIDLCHSSSLNNFSAISYFLRTDNTMQLTLLNSLSFAYLRQSSVWWRKRLFLLWNHFYIRVIYIKGKQLNEIGKFIVRGSCSVCRYWSLLVPLFWPILLNSYIFLLENIHRYMVHSYFY